MEMKIGRMIQSTYCKEKKYIRQTSADIIFGKARNANTDTFTISPFELPYSSRDSYFAMKLPSFSSEMRSQIMLLQNNFKQIREQGNNVQVEMINIAPDDYEGKAKWSLDFVDKRINELNNELAKKLKDAGIPEDVTFEFDYNEYSRELKITNVSDENYRESIESVLNNGTYYTGISFMSFASRIMNGYISSTYYPRIADALERCFGQDISELYIDEEGNIGGANENLQLALEAEKNTEDFNASKMFNFPADQIEAIIKRLISDENITENVSHMGYDGKGVYTNDGEIQFGKELDPKLFEDRGFIMRGAISLRYLFGDAYDLWVSNEEMFN